MLGKLMDDWERYLAHAIITVVSVTAVFVLAATAYNIFGSAPIKARAEETAWRERCISKGGSIIPTETAWMKGKGTYYTGWICARIERFDP